MNNIEILTIGLSKKINLHLVIKIRKVKNELIFSNDKLNIRAIFENLDIESGKKEYALFIIESLIEYIKEDSIDKIFKFANIKLRSGVENINKTLNEEMLRIIKKENGLITQKDDVVSFGQTASIEDIDFMTNRIYDSSIWTNY